MLFNDGPPIFVNRHDIEIEIMSRRWPKSKVYHVKRLKNNNQKSAVCLNSHSGFNHASKSHQRWSLFPSTSHYYTPAKVWGYIGITLTVRPSVCLCNRVRSISLVRRNIGSSNFTQRLLMTWRKKCKTRVQSISFLLTNIGSLLTQRLLITLGGVMNLTQVQ